MDRKTEFLKIKRIIKNNIQYAKCGLFDCKNLAGDVMQTLFDGEFFTLEICYGWEYFELFGANESEWHEIEKYYSSLGGLVL